MIAKLGVVGKWLLRIVMVVCGATAGAVAAFAQLKFDASGGRVALIVLAAIVAGALAYGMVWVLTYKPRRPLLFPTPEQNTLDPKQPGASPFDEMRLP